MSLKPALSFTENSKPLTAGGGREVSPPRRVCLPPCLTTQTGPSLIGQGEETEDRNGEAGTEEGLQKGGHA